MKKYYSLVDLKKDYPGPTLMIECENNIQYLNAKLIEASVGTDSFSNEINLIALFGIGLSEQILYVLVCGDLDDVEPFAGAYIDEYYVMAIKPALETLMAHK